MYVYIFTYIYMNIHKYRFSCISNIFSWHFKNNFNAEKVGLFVRINNDFVNMLW